MGNRALCNLGVILPFTIAGFMGLTVNNSVFAQLNPDDTVGTTVTTDTVNLLRDLIRGGTIRNNALFHSFSEFNVGEGREVFFDLQNNGNILNIFTRVTGGSSSNILGTLGVINDLGSANLFLLNPSGITFGANANLQLNGSFFATTADGFEFEDGSVFSVSGREAAPPLLTISIPRFASFRDNPGDITVNGNLEINSGQNITLLGGNVALTDAEITASGGNVNLGGLTAAGNIQINSDGSLIFPEGVVRGNVTLTNSEVNVESGGGGNININAGNLVIGDGSELTAGIEENQGDANSQAGDININVTGDITVSGSIRNNTPADGNNNLSGNGGNINITTDSLTINPEGRIEARTGGSGTGGNINITASGAVELINGARILADGNGNNSTGDSGDINITANSLSLESEIGASNPEQSFIRTRHSGSGDPGKIRINVVDTITLDGDGDDGGPFGINSQTRSSGSSGGVEINTRVLIMTNRGKIQANVNQSGATGNSGDIIINAESISLSSTSFITSFTRSEEGGNAGNIFINTNSLEIIGTSSSLSTEVRNEDTTGTGGNITITTNTLSLIDGGNLDSSTEGIGDAGNISITANQSVTISGTDDNFRSSGIFSRTLENATGKAGSINVQLPTGLLSLSNGGVLNTETRGTGEGGNVIVDVGILELLTGGQIVTTARSSGNAGNTNITASEQILISGVDNGFEERLASAEEIAGARNDRNVGDFIGNDGVSSGIFARTLGTGDAGSINVTTSSFTIEDSAQITVSSQGEDGGLGGNIDISSNTLTLDNGRITASTANDANGNIFLRISDYLRLLNGNGTLEDPENTLSGSSALISANSQGNGGNITIGGNLDAKGNVTRNTVALIATPGQDSDITADSTGATGGIITIGADAVFNIQASEEDSTDRNDITARSELGSGFSGEVIFTTPETNPGQEKIEQPEEVVDSSDIVSQSVCSDFGGDSQLANTGRGGVPQIPGFIIRNDVVDVELVDEVLLPPPPPEAIKPHHRTDVTFLDSEGEEFKPAMGAVLLPNGMVEFVDYNPAEVYRDMYAAAGCSS